MYNKLVKVNRCAPSSFFGDFTLFFLTVHVERWNGSTDLLHCGMLSCPYALNCMEHYSTFFLSLILFFQHLNDL